MDEYPTAYYLIFETFYDFRHFKESGWIKKKQEASMGGVKNTQDGAGERLAVIALTAVMK